MSRVPCKWQHCDNYSPATTKTRYGIDNSQEKGSSPLRPLYICNAYVVYFAWLGLPAVGLVCFVLLTLENSGMSFSTGSEALEVSSGDVWLSSSVIWNRRASFWWHAIVVIDVGIQSFFINLLIKMCERTRMTFCIILNKILVLTFLNWWIL